MKQWWGSPREIIKRAGCVQEAGVEGRNKGKLCKIAQYFASKKRKEAGTNKYREGTGFEGYGNREV